MRCLYQGRLVRDGEYFGHGGGDTKGSLASLIGEVELGFVQPNIMKTDFDRSSREWAEVEAAMHKFLSPIVREFQKSTEKRPATREERKCLGSVCDELAEAFRKLQEDRLWASSPEAQCQPVERGEVEVDPPVEGYGGRKPRRPGDERADSRAAGGTRRGSGKRKPTTVLDEEITVGRIIRLLTKVSGGGLKPPAVLEAFEPSVRSGSESKIVINTALPLYRALDAAAGYLAETVVMELAKPREGEARSLADYLTEVNAVTAAWARVHQSRR